MKVEGVSSSTINNSITDSSIKEQQAPSNKNTSTQEINTYLPDKKLIENAVKGLNESIKITHTNLQFKFHEDLNEYYVNIVNQDSGEVIKEIPSKEFLDKIAQLFKLVGLFVDEKR